MCQSLLRPICKKNPQSQQRNTEDHFGSSACLKHQSTKQIKRFRRNCERSIMNSERIYEQFWFLTDLRSLDFTWSWRTTASAITEINLETWHTARIQKWQPATSVLWQNTVIIHWGTENCALVGYYAACSGYFLPTFRDNQSVPSSGFKIKQRVVVISYWCLGTTYRSHPQDSRGPETSVSSYHYSLRSNPKERSSQLLRRLSLKSRNQKPGHRFFRNKNATAGPEWERGGVEA